MAVDLRQSGFLHRRGADPIDSSNGRRLSWPRFESFHSWGGRASDRGSDGITLSIATNNGLLRSPIQLFHALHSM